MISLQLSFWEKYARVVNPLIRGGKLLQGVHFLGKVQLFSERTIKRAAKKKKNNFDVKFIFLLFYKTKIKPCY